MDESHQPVAFLSYAHFNDTRDSGYLTNLQKELSAEIQAVTGRSFLIFQDNKDILWGQQWESRIANGIEGATFFIPIITPSYFNSTPCLEEFAQFLEREKQLGRSDLILPIYYMESKQIPMKAQQIAREAFKCQYFDWRPLRFKSFKTQKIKLMINQMAVYISDRLAELEYDNPTHPQADLVSPQRSSSFFQNEYLQPQGDLINSQKETLYGPPLDTSVLGITSDLVLRAPELKWTIDQLQDINKGLVAICGMPGVGKTSLAIQAINKLKESGIFEDGISVVQCQELVNHVEVLRKLLSRYDPYRRLPTTFNEIELRDKIQQAFLGKRTLVVLDDVHAQTNLQSLVIALRGSGASLLITSQRLTPSNVIPISARIELGSLSLEDALRLYLYSIGRELDISSLTTTELTHLKTIILALERHPLAIELVSAYSSELHLDLETLAAEFSDIKRILTIPRAEQPSVLDYVFSKSFNVLSLELQHLLVSSAAFGTLNFGRQALLSVAQAQGIAQGEICINKLANHLLLHHYSLPEMTLASDRQRLHVHSLIKAFVLGKFEKWEAVDKKRIYDALSTYYLKYIVNQVEMYRNEEEKSEIEGLKSWSRLELVLSADNENILNILDILIFESRTNKQLNESVFTICTLMQYYWRQREHTNELANLFAAGINAGKEMCAQNPLDNHHILLLSRLEVTYATFLLDVGEIDNAEEILKTALEARRRLNDKRAESAVLFNLGIVAGLRGDANQEELYLNECLNIVAQENMLHEQKAVLNMLARFEINRHNFVKAKLYLRRNQSVGKKDQYYSAWSENLYQSARLATLERKFEEAEKDLQHLLLEAETEILGQTIDKGLVLFELGNVARLQGKLEVGENYLQQSLRMAVETNNSRRKAIVLHGLCQLAIDRGELDIAEEYCTQSRDFFHILGDLRHEGMQLSSLGSIAYKKGQLDIAEPYLHEALSIAEKAQNISEIGVILVLIGHLARDRGHINEAKDNYVRSLPYLQQADRIIDFYSVSAALKTL